jgi:hypothetical protein
MWLGLLFLLIVGAGRKWSLVQRWHRETAPELTDLNPDQQAV